MIFLDPKPPKIPSMRALKWQVPLCLSRCRKKYGTSLTVYHMVVWYLLLCYIAPRTKTYQFLPDQKIYNRNEILPHHDNFCPRHGITLSITNTFPTQGLPQLTSLQHHPSDLFYFWRNHTIFTVKILLHGSHRNK
jgi:hypothetical protein